MLHEETALRIVSDWNFPKPEVIAAGDLNKWRFLVSTRLKGVELGEWRELGLWGELSLPEQLAITQQLGEVVAQLHRYSADRNVSLFGLWHERSRRLEKDVEKRYEDCGFSSSLVGSIQQFLQTVPMPRSEDVLLHCDLRPGNLIVQRGTEGWRLQGLFDFEDCQAGPREWDILSPALNRAQGQNGFFRAFLKGYGDFQQSDYESLQIRLMAAFIRRESQPERYYADFPEIMTACGSLKAFMMKHFAVNGLGIGRLVSVCNIVLYTRLKGAKSMYRLKV